MSAAVIASNVTTKVNRAITGATTVNANCYAVVSYRVSTSTPTLGPDSLASGGLDTIFFGPGQSIPNTYQSFVGGPGTNTALQTHLLISGVEFINSP